MLPVFARSGNLKAKPSKSLSRIFFNKTEHFSQFPVNYIMSQVELSQMVGSELQKKINKKDSVELKIPSWSWSPY